MEAVIDFIFSGSKTTVNGDCTHEIKRCLFLGRKAMTSLDNTVKSRNINLLTGAFPRSQFFSSGGQGIEVSVSASVLPIYY